MDISFNNIHRRYIGKTNAVNNYKSAVSFETFLGGGKVSGSCPSKSDTVSISADAVSYNSVNRAVKDIADEVNSAGLSKISYIRESIENGTYDVSASDVADAILKRFGL